MPAKDIWESSECKFYKWCQLRRTPWDSDRSLWDSDKLQTNSEIFSYVLFSEIWTLQSERLNIYLFH